MSSSPRTLVSAPTGEAASAVEAAPADEAAAPLEAATAVKASHAREAAPASETTPAVPAGEIASQHTAPIEIEVIPQSSFRAHCENIANISRRTIPGSMTTRHIPNPRSCPRHLLPRRSLSTRTRMVVAITVTVMGNILCLMMRRNKTDWIYFITFTNFY